MLQGTGKDNVNLVNGRIPYRCIFKIGTRVLQWERFYPVEWSTSRVSAAFHNAVQEAYPGRTVPGVVSEVTEPFHPIAKTP